MCEISGARIYGRKYITKFSALKLDTIKRKTLFGNVLWPLYFRLLYYTKRIKAFLYQIIPNPKYFNKYSTVCTIYFLCYQACTIN